MKNIAYFIVSISYMYGLTSCAGSRKNDFDLTYKFSSYKYQKSIDQNLKPKQDESELTASLNPEINSDKPVEISEFEKRMYEKMDLSSEQGTKLDKKEIQLKVKQLNNREKREIRRDIKTELRQMNLEAENTYSTIDVQRVNQISEIMRWSILIGSAGLVLLILGAIFSAGLLTLFGALFVVGGVVLFILDQL